MKVPAVENIKNPDNLLRFERSPYLRQHADNPVNWYPWGDEAFRRARQEEKPVLLSIGYSACHWCHVMAHESFENKAIAETMNEYFVNIKVDREEFPDIDHIYQSFVQMTTGRGGWPLTVFLTAERIPFYGGTYFPPAPRHGMISFPELLKRIHEVYQNDREKIVRNSAEIREVMKNMDRAEATEDLPDFERVTLNLFRHLEQVHDPVHGGFSQAPKFPHAADINFLMNDYHYNGNKKSVHMALYTLKEMGKGGIYDQIGGGFHRYSTDHRWLVPHFEKMLYDNALLIPLYADAFRLSGDNFFVRIAEESTDFVLRELYDPSAGFFSTLDADSEGEEGKYYVWNYDEILEHLDEDIREIFINYYGISRNGNFEGKNILHVSRPLKTLFREGAFRHIDDPERHLDEVRKKLFKIRGNRIRPDLDDKILTDWNGMMITALWSVYEITRKTEYREAAETVTGIILDRYMRPDGKIFHFLKNNEQVIAGYIDDYSYFIKALLDGYEAVRNIDYLKNAIVLTEYVLKNFQDRVNGGFYLTGSGAENTFVRPRNVFDASTPAGNSMMCLNLLRLRSYTGRQHYEEAAERLFCSAGSDLEHRTAGVASLVTAGLLFRHTPVEYTVSGEGDDFFRELQRLYVPYRISVAVPEAKEWDLIDPMLIEGRQKSDGKAVFICHKGTCSLPVIDPGQVFRILDELNLETGTPEIKNRSRYF